MTDVVAAAEAPAPIPSETIHNPVKDEGKILSVREAARLLASQRKKQEAAAPQAVEAPPVIDLAQPADTEPQEKPAPIGETAEAPEPQETAPIDAPGSWAAEDKERFASLPPEVQEIIATREKERDNEIRRRQNEVAERLRQIEPEYQAMQQARNQYEQAAQYAFNALQASGEFSDIQTMEDVEKLARDDWPRYVQYDAHTKKLAAYQQQVEYAQQQRAAEWQQQWTHYASEQDRLFAEKIPEFADDAKREKLQKLAVETLERDYGFSAQEMAHAWNGPFRDHRVQQLLLDAARYRQLQKNPPKPAAKPLPPVQRPGVAAPVGKGAHQDAEMSALEKKSTLSLKEAARLTRLQRLAKG